METSSGRNAKVKNVSSNLFFSFSKFKASSCLESTEDLLISRHSFVIFFSRKEVNLWSNVTNPDAPAVRHCFEEAALVKMDGMRAATADLSMMSAVFMSRCM